MSDLIRKDDAVDILCKFCGITEDVEKCRKTSADGWCKEYCELKNMPTVEAIPIDFIMSEIYVEESVAERTYASFFWRELIELWKALKENWK